MSFTRKQAVNLVEGGCIHNKQDGFRSLLTLVLRFVEFETANDLKTAIEKLDGRDFKGSRVSCVADVRVILRLSSSARSSF
jgi:hypothetical protein